MPSTDEIPPLRGRDELLHTILHAGRRRKRRRRTLGVGGVVALAVCLSAAALNQMTGDDGHVKVAAQGDRAAASTTTTVEATTPPPLGPVASLPAETPTVAPDVSRGARTPTLGARPGISSFACTNSRPTGCPPRTGISSATPPTTTHAIDSSGTGTLPMADAPATTSPPEVSPSTTGVCRNSFDPACGPFRWDPDAGPNAPLEADGTATLRQDNRTVDLRAVFADKDAGISTGCISASWGDGASYSNPMGCAMTSCATAYGPWTPPPRKESTYPIDFGGHTYAAPGTYTITLSGISAADTCYNPYASSGEKRLTVVVPN